MGLTFEQLEQLLKAAKADGLSAEVHGFMTGWIASGSSWQSAGGAFKETFQGDVGAELGASLKDLAQGILTGLADEDLSFKPLLPEDGRSLNVRRIALSEWCRGFLSGFGLTGRFQEVELSEEVKELLGDFSQIAQVDEELPDDEDNESDLTEITEYVRMGAIMVFTDCASKAVH